MLLIMVKININANPIIRLRTPKCFSNQNLIFFPTKEKIIATKKNLIPLAISDTIMNKIKLKPTTPLVIVNNLYGKGDIPAKKIISTPKSLKVDAIFKKSCSIL